MFKNVEKETGAYTGICSMGLTFLSFQGAQHPLGPENPLETIDLTAPQGVESPYPPPPYVRLRRRRIFVKNIK